VKNQDREFRDLLQYLSRPFDKYTYHSLIGAITTVHGVSGIKNGELKESGINKDNDHLQK
jgi:hypothetical protein